MRAITAVSSVEFKSKGYWVRDQFLSTAECDHFLQLIARYRQTHDVPEVYRKVRGRSLRYRVIDGINIRQHLPEVRQLYLEVNEIVNRATGQTLAPLADEKVGVNINITPAGGSYRWHYDRNAVTVIVYLNEVVGGETECYPNYRIFLKQARYSTLQRWLDNLMQTSLVRRLFGKLVVVKPRRGTLFMMQGNTCLHSVRPVEGSTDRINMILSYDLPGANFAVAPQLDSYLYTQDSTQQRDPNYVK